MPSSAVLKTASTCEFQAVLPMPAQADDDARYNLSRNLIACLSASPSTTATCACLRAFVGSIQRL